MSSEIEKLIEARFLLLKALELMENKEEDVAENLELTIKVVEDIECQLRERGYLG